MTQPKSKRNLNTQLPSAQELQFILGHEAQRKLPAGKEEAHYVDFKPAIALLNRFDLPTGLLQADLSVIRNAERKIVQEGKELVDRLVAKILTTEPTETDTEIFKNFYGYLSEQDEPAPADLIFVFGSKTPVRIEKAIELYQGGLSNRIMISGGHPFYIEDGEITEAERYKQLAVERGIPESSIIIENKSITIPDNVRSSLNLLDNSAVQFSSIILVNSPYTQRRGWVHFKKYLPESMKLIRVNSKTIDKYQPDRWYRDPDGIRTLANEFIKMRIAVALNTA